MAFEIRVRYPNPGHRFLGNIQIVLQKGGADLPRSGPRDRATGNPRGEQVFRVDGDPYASNYTLRVVVGPPPAYSPPRRRGRPAPTPHPTYTRNLLELEQRFGVEGGGRLTPVAGAFTGWHPRVRPGAARGARGAGGAHAPAHGALASLELDLHFLDVTDYFETTRPGAFREYFFLSRGPDGRVLDPQPETVQRFEPEKYHGCKLRLMQCTATPGVWGVLVPPAIPSAATGADMVVFFGPAGDAYTSIDNVGLASLSRYLSSKADGTWWGYAGRVEDTPWRYFTTINDVELVASTPTPSNPSPLPTARPHIVRLADTRSPRVGWFPWPHCRFDAQLAASGKRAIFAFLVPHGGSFGVAAGAGLPRLTRSLSAALWGDGVVAPDQRASFTRNKLAIMGYSYGGGEAYGAFVANRNVVDEVWLFDPNHLGTMGSALASWIRDTSKDRRLRLVAGYQAAAQLSMARSLGAATSARGEHRIPDQSGARASVWPMHLSFWSHAAARGRAFWIAEGSGAGTTAVPARLDSVSESELRAEHARRRAALRSRAPLSPADSIFRAAPGSLSGKTGVYLVRPENPETTDSVRIVGLAQNGAILGPASFARHHPEEIAYFVYRALGVGLPAERRIAAALWRPLVAAIVGNRWDSTHQWPVSGGQTVGDGPGDDAGNMVGYFELCLRFSTFEGSPPAAQGGTQGGAQGPARGPEGPPRPPPII